jgi:hypothetical protein
MKHTMFVSLISALLCLQTGPAVAQWQPFITNFEKGSYGSGSQTWQISSFDNNWVYFANRGGLLQFNGNEWQQFPMHNGADARSVHICRRERRIYVGGVNEFGYYEPDRRGALFYHCLSDSIPEWKRNIGNIWNVLECEHVFYYIADRKVLKYIDGQYTLINTPAKIESSNSINGLLFIGTEKGVFALMGKTFVPIRDDEQLRGKRICALLPYDDKMLIVTSFSGLYLYDEIQLKPFITGFEDFLAHNEVFCATISDKQIALGTIQKGILMLERGTMHPVFFHEYNGLQNNTVLSLHFDSAGNLWAGLDSGIDYIWLDRPLTNLYTFPYFYGSGYTVALGEGKLYLGTNRRLLQTDYPVHTTAEATNIREVPSSSGQVWGLERVGNDLFCLHDRGLFLLKGGKLHRIGNCVGIWSLQPIGKTTDKAYVGAYDGLYIIQKQQTGWNVTGKIANFYDAVYNFQQESPTTLWIHINSKGVERIELDLDNYRIKQKQVYGIDKGFPSNNDVSVNRINGKIRFSTSNGIFLYNPARDRMEPDSVFNRLFAGPRSYARLFEFGHHIFSINNDELCLMDTRNKNAKVNFYSLDYMDISLINNSETLIPLSDSLFVLPNAYGFALLNTAESHSPAHIHQLAKINKVYLTIPKDSLIYENNYLNNKYIPEIRHSESVLRIEYGIRSGQIQYQYKLKEQREWSQFTRSLTKEYTGLSIGEHTFLLRAVFNDGTVITDEFTFRILPPWYYSVWACLLYLLLFAGIVNGLLRWDKWRVNSKRLAAIQEKDLELKHQQKEFEKENERKEHQIMELEKEKLQHDIKHKSQEITNLMLDATRKNEILISLKQELMKIFPLIKGEGLKEAKQMLLLLNNKIEVNIESNEVMRRIEENFDLVHNDFMKKLHARYPYLSKNEQLMCVYLKMNLSTKEISPLMNLSARGVETLRYRLRKKFSLDREENLTDYLNTIT